MRKKTSKDFLKCILTQDERNTLGDDLAQQYIDIQQLEEQKKSATSNFKAKIDAATADASQKARVLKDGYEMRDVEVETRYDASIGLAIIVRKDTGEIIKQRPLTQEERQQELELEDRQPVAPPDTSGPTAYNGKGHLALPDPDVIDGDFSEDEEDNADEARPTDKLWP